MNEFWYNFFTSGWVSSGLLFFFPFGLIIITCICWIAIACDDDTEHGKWMTRRGEVVRELHKEMKYNDTKRVDELKTQLDALKEKEPQTLSFRGKLIAWSFIFLSVFLLITGFVTDHYCTKIKTAYLVGDSQYVVKKVPKVKDYVLLKEDDDTLANGIKREVKKVDQADEIVLKLDNGRTIKMPGPQSSNGGNLHKFVKYRQSVMTGKHGDKNKLDMKLTIIKPKAKYQHYRGFKTNYVLVVTQNF